MTWIIHRGQQQIVQAISLNVRVRSEQCDRLRLQIDKSNKDIIVYLNIYILSQLCLESSVFFSQLYVYATVPMYGFTGSYTAISCCPLSATAITLLCAICE